MNRTTGYSVDRPQRVLTGRGALDGLGDAVREAGIRRPLLVTSPSVATRTDVLDRVRAALPADATVAVFADAREHTPLESVAAAAGLAREHAADGIIGAGGGSALDTAKGIVLSLLAGSADIAAFVGTRDNLDAFLAARGTTGAAPPLIQVPTTLSAAEGTRQAGLTRPDGIKEQFFHPAVEASVIVHDPVLTVDTPRLLWLTTGIKALDHAVELMYSRQANDFAVALARHAARVLVTNLPATEADPTDLAARARLQTAAWLAAHGAMRTGAQMGLDHALGHRLGGYFGISHGVAACITLPASMAANRPSATEQLAGLARHGFDLAIPGDTEAADAAVAATDALIDGLGLPRRLREYVAEPGLLEPLPKLVLSDTAMAGNPHQGLTENDIAVLLEKVW